MTQIDPDFLVLSAYSELLVSESGKVYATLGSDGWEVIPYGDGGVVLFGLEKQEGGKDKAVKALRRCWGSQIGDPVQVQWVPVP